jgi:hypothetical protein
MTIKVIQWATVPVGRSALRHVLINPDYVLVAVFAHARRKTALTPDRSSD